MVGNKDFSQYLAAAKAKQPTPTSAFGPARSASTKLDFSKVKSPANNGGQDFLSWAVDILSRPMRAVENIPNSIFDEMLKQQAAKKTGANYDVAGAIGNVLTSPVRGLFSNSPSDQPTGAQLIEKGTDAIGGSNPNYVNTQDNVNPWVKGIGGFGLDVGLDPLSYAPVVGQIAKGAQLVGKFAKGAAVAADAGLATTNFGKAVGSELRTTARANKAAADAAATEEFLAKSKEAAKANLGSTVPTGPKIADAPTSLNTESVLKASEAFRASRAAAPTAEKVAATTAGVAKADANKALSKAVSAEDAATLALDKLAAKTAAQKAASENIIAQWAAKPETVSAIRAAVDKFTPAPAVEAIAKAPEVVTDIPAQIAKLESDKAKIQESIGRSKSDTVYNTGVEKMSVIDTQIKALKTQAKSLSKETTAAAKATETAAARFTLSSALKNVLQDPAAVEQVKSALGPKAFESLVAAKGSSKKIGGIIDHINRMLEGDIVTASRTNKEIVHDIMSNHDIKVPDTNVTATTGVSAVDSTLTVQIATEKAQGHDLVEAPLLWPGNYDPLVVEEVAKDMPDWLKRDFTDLEGYHARTGTGAHSTSDIMGEGKHKYAYELNQWDQWTVGERLIARDRARLKEHNAKVAKSNPGAMIAGEQRANQLMDRMFQKIELAMRVMDRKGATVFMGQNATRFRLYQHQMLAALRDASVESDVLRIAMFNEETSVPMTNIMDAITAIFHNPNIGDTALMAELTKTIKGADNFLTGEATTGRWRHYLEKPKNGLWMKNEKDGKLNGYYGLVTKEQVGKDLLAAIKESAPTLKTVVAHNDDMAIARWGQESGDISPSFFNQLVADASNPEEFGNFIRDTANTVTSASKHAQANLVTPQMHGFFAKACTDYLSPVILHDSQQITKIQEAAMSWRSKDMRNSLRQLGIEEGIYLRKQAKGTVLARKGIKDGVDANGHVVDEILYENAVAKETFLSAIDNAAVSPAAKAFKYGAGMQDVIHDFDRTDTVIHAMNTSYYKEIERLMGKYGTNNGNTTVSVLDQAFRNISKGVTSPETAAAEKELLPVIYEIMGNPEQANAIGIWQRAGATLEDVEVYMRKAKMDFPIDMSIAREAARDGDLLKAGLGQWTKWADTMENPMQFLTKMHHAASMLLIDNTAVNLFMKIPNAVTNKAASGFTKVGKLDPFAHPLLSRVPEGTYVSDDIIGQVRNLEEKVMQDMSPKSEFGKWLNEKYIPMLGLWKKGVTIYRPGHHIRNLLSSEGIQYTVEGTKYYGRSGSAAMKALMIHKSYNGVSWAEKAGGKEIADMPNAADLVMTFGNKEISITDLYKAAEEHGLFTDFKHIEDLFDTNTPGAFAEFMNKASLSGTKLEKVAGDLSEYQAHFSRLHHFTQILMKQGKKGGNWDKAIRDAAVKVKRHHPDGLTLTNFEKQYIKPIIPFYSWFRQIIPVVAEGIVTHPGRFMQYPKASYNLAVSMGVNPQSIQDPFPADQLFPSFITDQLTGPVAFLGGNYYTAQPGYAYADVLNQFGADPKRGLVSMITPFIKTPGEVLTGTKWDTGSKISDFSDYVDSQIPGVNYISNFTGTSVSGSVASVVSGHGLDPQYAVSKGNKTVWDQGVSAYNWFTGMGVQNVTKPNLVNFAELEKRNAAIQAAKEAAGTARNPF